MSLPAAGAPCSTLKARRIANRTDTRCPRHPGQPMQPALDWARARPLHAAAALCLALPAAFLASPLLLGIAVFAAPVLVPALLFCAVSSLAQRPGRWLGAAGALASTHPRPPMRACRRCGG